MTRVDTQRSPSNVPSSDTRRPDAVAGSAAAKSVPAGGLVAVHHTSFADVESLRDEWDAFVERIGGDLFSTFDWCRVWWQHYDKGRSLHLVVVRDEPEGAIAAVLPFFAERIWIGPFPLRALRLVGCDHSVTSVAPAVDPPRISEVLSHAFEWLESKVPWDIIQLGPLPGYFEAREQLQATFRKVPAVADIELRPTEPHMWFDLPASFDEFLAALSTKERRNARRDERKLEEQGEITREVVTNRASLDEAFDIFIDMHQAHWKAQGCLGHFADWPRAVAFHKDMVHRMFDLDRLMLSRVRIDGDTIASEYSYVFGRRAHWILAARQPGVPGRIGFCGLVRHACERGAVQVDAMRGYYDYKRLLGAKQEPQYSLVAVRRGTLPKLRFALFRVAARFLDLAYYRLYFSRVAPKLPWTPSPLWRSWIRSRV